MLEYSNFTWAAALSIFFVALLFVLLASRVRATWARNPEQLFVLMNRLGIELGAFSGKALATDVEAAMAKCKRCPNADVCSAWERGQGNGDSPLAFCPNAGFIRRVQRLAHRY